MDKMNVVQIGVANFGARRRQIMRESGLFNLVAAEASARNHGRPERVQIYLGEVK